MAVSAFSQWIAGVAIAHGENSYHISLISKGAFSDEAMNDATSGHPAMTAGMTMTRQVSMSLIQAEPTIGDRIIDTITKMDTYDYQRDLRVERVPVDAVQMS
ncbi:hypothetical protein F5883DRAFT_652988 [Diaporthe sp. PMI_573]|nr:hypothetical protein F5883DRAFT_652988 [Diaporthaceae sp. PMI_573]